jgi:heterodisulfide reductase subunit B
MKVAYFIGCNTALRTIEYDGAARKICEKLGVELVESPEFVCCGYPSGPADHDTSIALAAQNLIAAEEMGVDMLVATCSSCTGTLTKVNRLLKENDEERKHINGILKESINKQFSGTIKVKHFTRFLVEDIGIDKIKEKITRDFLGLKVSPHYGCHYLRPPEIFDNFDDPIKPESLVELVEVTGASITPYENMNECCGGAILAVDEETSVKMVKSKLEHVHEAGSNILIVHCPFCRVMYSEYQMDERVDLDYKIDVVFVPQLLGLAMDIKPKKLGLRRKLAKKILGDE